MAVRAKYRRKKTDTDVDSLVRNSIYAYLKKTLNIRHCHRVINLLNEQFTEGTEMH